MEKEVTIKVNAEGLDVAIEKAKQLVELLKEAQLADNKGREDLALPRAVDARKGVLMEKIDKEADGIAKFQEELDRRTKAELKAIKLITEGRHKEAIAILAALDDEAIKKLSGE